jgi:heme exporter protein C
MWKWLHPYAKAENTYRLCGKLLPWFSIIALISILVGSVWGLLFVPADYQQGDSFRIIYIHVPAAIWSMSIYVTMAISSFIGLVWQIRMSDMAASAMAPIGAVFTFIALITGAIWGKPMWGAWWVWDARLTSELILLFLHQGATISKFGKPSMSDTMLWPLLVMLLGFGCFFAAVTLVRLRNEILLRESHRPWVQKLVK